MPESHNTEYKNIWRDEYLKYTKQKLNPTTLTGTFITIGKKRLINKSGTSFLSQIITKFVTEIWVKKCQIALEYKYLTK